MLVHVVTKNIFANFYSKFRYVLDIKFFRVELETD
jgi:hypothetical protein